MTAPPIPSTLYQDQEKHKFADFSQSTPDLEFHKDLSSIATDSSPKQNRYLKAGRARGFSQAELKRRRQKVHFGLVVLFIIVYMSYMIGRSFLSSRRGMSPETTRVLMDTIHFLGEKMHVKHHNMSTLANGTLPTHYTLPSGDRIPAVALGMILTPANAIKTLTTIYLGVWKAGPGQVGPAVKVRENSRAQIILDLQQLPHRRRSKQGTDTLTEHGFMVLVLTYLSIFAFRT